MTCSKGTVKATGLNIWVSGEHHHHVPKVDVIAVQGLGAHPYYTWVRKQGRRRNAQADGLSDITQAASGAVETMWLRDLLPEFIAHARIATYSYESDWRKAEVKTSLRKCGEQLLNVLHQNRSSERESRRPLVFVGHSLGGLIIKQALVLADHGDDFINIRLSTAGIIFLGTPHHGSDAAVYALWLAQAVGHDKTLLESLKRNSPSLFDIAKDFESTYRNADILVDQQSATLHGRRMIYLTTDHSGLNKFHGTEDENFCLVRPEIQRMVQNAPEMIEARYRSYALINGKDFRIDFSLQGIPVVSRFVARDVEMNRLRQELIPISTNEMRRKVFVLHGLGGIGKTQLSIEFARIHHRSYSAVFWIDGSTKERLNRSIADLAGRLPQNQISETTRSYSQEESSNVEEVVQEILQWLSQPSNDQWLLIFDNVDREFSASSGDPEAFDVEDYFPKADQGSILVTTRLASLWQLGIDLKLEPVDELQGESILKNSFGKPIEGSSKLVSLLQGLPLAINQAGSFMRETGTNVSGYIELYDHAWKKLMSSQNRFTWRETTDRSVLTTWTLSFTRLRAQSQEAANLLLLWAFLDNQDLWYGLLAPALNQKFVDKMPDWFVRCAGDELRFKECIRFLLKYSFIDAKTESSSFSIHSVFHHWCFHAFEEETAISRLAVIIVASAVPSENTLHYSLIQRRLLPHCDRVFSLALQRMQATLIDGEDLRWQSDAYDHLGDLYLDQDRINEAKIMYLQALAGYEKVCGPEHASTLDTVNKLGILYTNQGKMEEAEEMYLRALAGFEKAWGPEHASTLGTVKNLGILYKNQGKMKKAEIMLLQALTGYEKTQEDPECKSILDTVNSLGNLYSNQGKMKEAEEMYLQALTGYEKAWGLKHTFILDTVYNLGLFYIKQGKMKEAEEMLLRALTGYEKAWGLEHTLTLNTVKNLGICLYMNHDKMKEAEEIFLRALTGYEKAWGLEHTLTLAPVQNLGVLYMKQGKIDKAEEMYLRALAGYEKAQGPEYTSTLDTVCNLGCLYKDQSRMNEAEEMYLRAWTGYEKAQGPEHKSTLDTVSNLGALYSNQGRTKEAEDMYLRALTGYEKALDPAEYISTFDTAYNLAVLYTSQSKMKEAEEMYLRALTGYEKALDPVEYTSTFDTAYNLAVLYTSQSKMKEAEEMYLRALVGYEKARGPEHTSIIDTVYGLGALYKDLGRIKEAEKMLIRALTASEKAQGLEHISTMNIVLGLGALRIDQGRMNEAEEMYLRALTGYEKAQGSEHTSTINTVYSLGALYKDQGRMKEAEGMYLRAWTGYEKAQGPEHTSTLDTICSLGALYKDQGRMKEAEEMYLRALTGCEKAQDSKLTEHTLTLDIVNNLGLLYKDQGKTEEAEKMYLQALTRFQKAQGPEHTSTLKIVENLRLLYLDQGKSKEAEDMN